MNSLYKEVKDEYQKVYVEELGKEAYMDQEGNLYDIDGNFIGEAEEC